MAEFSAGGNDFSAAVFAFRSIQREMVDRERATVLLQEVASVCEPTTAVLSNKSFSEEASWMIGDQLGKYSSSLTSLDISDIIAGRMEVEALVALRNICNPLKEARLIDLNLSDNALGAPGVESCRAVLSGKLLRAIKVCNCGLSAEAATLLHSILADGGMPPLELFHFYNNMSGDGGAVAVAKIISENVMLKDLRFSATRSMKPGCKAIAEAISTLRKLVRLDVSDNVFGKKAGTILADAVKNNPDLTFLNLRDSGLEEEGSIAFIAAISEGGLKVEYLDLSGNEVSTDVLETSERPLSALTSIKELLLDDNEFGSDGAEVLAKVVRRLNSLTYLSVCFCNLTAAGAYRIARAVSSIESFKTLKIDGNQICGRGMMKITELFKKSGKTLVEIDENDDDGDDDLDDALDDENDEVEGGDSGVDGGFAAVTEDVDELSAGFSATKI